MDSDGELFCTVCGNRKVKLPSPGFGLLGCNNVYCVSMHPYFISCAMQEKFAEFNALVKRVADLEALLDDYQKPSAMPTRKE